MAQPKMKFNCSKCGAETDAEVTTERYKKQLCRPCFGKRKDNRTNQLNDLTGTEWARHSKSIEAYPDIRTPNQKEHGACFPKALARHQIPLLELNSGRLSLEQAFLHLTDTESGEETEP